MGTMSIGNQTALYTLVMAEQIGTASGLFPTAGYIGSIASSAIISVVYHKSVSDSELHIIAIIMSAVSTLALLLTVTDRWVMALSRPPYTSAVSKRHFACSINFKAARLKGWFRFQANTVVPVSSGDRGL